MGNSIISGNSSNNRNGTSNNDDESHRRRRHTDLIALCERVSFGDDELSQLYDTYHMFLLFQQQQSFSSEVLQLPSQESRQPSSQEEKLPPPSFFCDWYQARLQHHFQNTTTTTTTTTTTIQGQSQQLKQQQQPQLLLLQILQKVVYEILPLNFDNALYRTCFIVPEDSNNNNHYQYSNSNSDDDSPIATTTTSTPSTILNDDSSHQKNSDTPTIPPSPPSPPVMVYMDEYTRTTRLYQFFHALSICNGRRSSKDSMTILFRTVHTLQQSPLQQPSSPQETKNIIETPPPEPVVSAQFLMETGYRLAVAMAYIEQQQQQEIMIMMMNKEEDEEEEEDKGKDEGKDDKDKGNETVMEHLPPKDMDGDNEGTKDPSKPPPPPPIQTFGRMILTTEAQASIQAMAMSIVELRNVRLRQQSTSSSSSYYYPTPISSASSISTTSMSMSLIDINSNNNNNANADNHTDMDDNVELMDVLEWMETVAPMFPYILSTFFQFLLFPNTNLTSNHNNHKDDDDTIEYTPTTSTTTKVLGRTTFAIPKIITLPDHNKTGIPPLDTMLHPKSTTSSSSSIDASALLSVRHFIVACFGTTLNGYYYPIYNSNTDGLSFNRLQNAILGYGGPTLFVLQSVSGGIFGAYTGTAWKESKDFYGNTDSFLYQLQPQVAVYRPKSSSSGGGGNGDQSNNYMYCNSAARSRGYDQQAHGIGFGGTVQQPRLFISENFDDGSCIASAQDLTYDNGLLLPTVGTSGYYNYNNSKTNNNTTTTIQRHRSVFDIECIEVYGVSDEWDVITMAIGSRTINRANKDELIRKARKVDKAQFLDDFQSGIIASKAFVHRQQIDGRADDDCLLKKQQTE